jgi:hypothetical protein
MSYSRITYSDLKVRLDRLGASLLPSDRLAGDYSEEDKDRIHAYILLAHAEFEEYFERLALYIADQARRKSSPTKCTTTISRLLTWRAMQGKDRFESPSDESIASAFTSYEKSIEKNLGIKKINVMSMFLPLGMTHADLDVVLMTNLDEFGKFRGDLAHTAARLRQGSSPSMERTRVANILRDLSHFDEKARALK